MGKAPVKSYRVHKGVLTFYSGFFDKALKGEFKEAAQNAVDLPETEPAVFDSVQNWLYSHQLHPAKEADPKKMSYLQIQKLWVFGDAHNIPALQNDAINLLHQAIVEQWTVPSSSLHHLYDNTMPNAPLRRYCIDIISNSSSAASLLSKNKDQQKLFPKEALVDILKVVWTDGHKVQSKEAVKMWNMCEYHVHEDGVTCSKKDA